MNRDERGLTLIEILIALAIFAIIIVGALGAIGSTASGFMEGFPTAFVSGRAAKDYTVASVYLQAFQEYMADYLTDVTITGAEGTNTFTASPTPPTDVFGFTPPSGQPYQLDWEQMVVTVQRWYWDCAAANYSPSAATTDDQVILVRATLTWRYQGQNRSVPVERFVPYRPDIPLAVTACP